MLKTALKKHRLACDKRLTKAEAVRETRQLALKKKLERFGEKKRWGASTECGERFTEKSRLDYYELKHTSNYL